MAESILAPAEEQVAQVAPKPTFRVNLICVTDVNDIALHWGKLVMTWCPFTVIDLEGLANQHNIGTGWQLAAGVLLNGTVTVFIINRFRAATGNPSTAMFPVIVDGRELVPRSPTDTDGFVPTKITPAGKALCTKDEFMASVDGMPAIQLFTQDQLRSHENLVATMGNTRDVQLAIGNDTVVFVGTPSKRLRRTGNRYVDLEAVQLWDPTLTETDIDSKGEARYQNTVMSCVVAAPLDEGSFTTLEKALQDPALEGCLIGVFKHSLQSRLVKVNPKIRDAFRLLSKEDTPSADKQTAFVAIVNLTHQVLPYLSTDHWTPATLPQLYAPTQSACFTSAPNVLHPDGFVMKGNAGVSDEHFKDITRLLVETGECVVADERGNEEYFVKALGAEPAHQPIHRAKAREVLDQIMQVSLPERGRDAVLQHFEESRVADGRMLFPCRPTSGYNSLWRAQATAVLEAAGWNGEKISLNNVDTPISNLVEDSGHDKGISVVLLSVVFNAFIVNKP